MKNRTSIIYSGVAVGYLAGAIINYSLSSNSQLLLFNMAFSMLMLFGAVITRE